MSRKSLIGSPGSVSIELAEHLDPDETKRVRRQSLFAGAAERIAVGKSHISDLASQLNTNINTGLSNDEVAQKLAEFGPNELQEAKAKPLWRILLEQFNVLNILVLLCGVLSVSGIPDDDPDWIGGGILFGIVFLCVLVGGYMEWSCSKMMASMSDLAAPSCKVIRGGEEVLVDFKQIVPGDIVLLKNGDVIPADCRVLQVSDLMTNEMALTGEPHDIQKTLEPLDPSSPFPSNMVYALTNVVDGSGTALVVKTGMDTEIGKVAQSLLSNGLGLSSVQKTLNTIGFMVTIAVIFLTVGIFLFSFFLRVDDPADPCPSKEDTNCFAAKSFKRAVFAAVGAIPETLQPACMFLLVTGCAQLKKKNAATRSLSTVDTISACSFICSDKTGTLTEGKMTLMRLVPRVRKSVGQSFAFYPTRGFNPMGGIFDAKSLSDDAKQRLDKLTDQEQLGEVLPDFGDPRNASPETKLVRTCMMALHLNSHNTELVREGDSWTVTGNMSEGALVVGAAKARLQGQEFHQRYARDADLEVPFSSSRKMAVTVHKLPQSGSFEGLHFEARHTHLAVVKGAPDVILPALKAALVAQGDSYAADGAAFNAEDRAWFEQENATLAALAYRVLCVAVQPLSASDISQLRGLGSPDERLSEILKGSMLLLGVAGLMDPVRGSAKEAVHLSHKAGIRVAMITGDQQPTAVAIAKELGIIRPGMDEKRSVSECAALGSLSNQLDVDELCNRVVVWSRAQPTDKITIVESLQRQGHTVAMTGDGMNDAGALKKADIGLAMGIAGSDITKQAADIILLDDRFATIVDAVDEGRRIFANIQRMTMYLLCVNVFEIIVLMIASLLGWLYPIEDSQLFFANLITHEFYPWCMVVEAAFRFNMQRPPYSKKSNLIPPLMRNVLMGSVFVLYTLTLLSAQYVGSTMYLGTTDRDRNMGTDSIANFFDSKQFFCLHANTIIEKDGKKELQKDFQPLICSSSKFTIAGWVEYAEYGRAKTLDNKLIECKNKGEGGNEIPDKTNCWANLMQFDRVTGQWLEDTFSLEHSFLKEDLTAHPQFPVKDEDWKNDYIKRCSQLPGLEGVPDDTKIEWKDNLCWLTDAEGKPAWKVKTSAHTEADKKANMKQTTDQAPGSVSQLAAELEVASTAASSLRRLRAGRTTPMHVLLQMRDHASKAHLTKSSARGEDDDDDGDDDDPKEDYDKPALFGKFNSNAWGARQMRTLVLTTMLLSEAFLLLAFSKYDTAVCLLFENITFVLAWVPMIGVYCLYVYISPNVWNLKWCPPDSVSFCISVLLALIFYALLEASKAIYRNMFSKELDREIITASLLADGVLPAFNSPKDAQTRVPNLWVQTAKKLTEDGSLGSV